MDRNNSSGNKFSGVNPRGDFDFIVEPDFYSPNPGHDQKNLTPYWRAQIIGAEMASRGNAAAQYAARLAGRPQAMVVAAVTSGRGGYQKAAQYPERILEHSEGISPGDPHMTVQDLSRAMDPEILVSDVIEPAKLRASILTNTARGNMPNVDFVPPYAMEGTMRAGTEIYPMRHGAAYEDYAFEVYWGRKILFDVNACGFWGDYAWSRNGAFETNLVMDMQFGMDYAMAARQHEQIEAVDIHGEAVRPVDLAWEAARHIIDVTTWKVAGAGAYDGEDYAFRTDPAVAFLAGYFAREELFQQAEYKGMDRASAHPLVKAHYKDEDSQKLHAFLKERMLPYMAVHCDTPTLRKAMAHFPVLGDYWDNVIAQSAAKIMPISEIAAPILARVPPQGHHHVDLQRKAQDFADQAKIKLSISRPSYLSVAREPHAHIPQPRREVNPFDPKFDNKRFDDHPFERLGEVKDPKRDRAAQDQYNTYQVRVIEAVNAITNSCVPARERPRRGLYLDSAQNGVRMKSFREDGALKGKDPSGLSANFDPFAEGGESYGHKYGSDAARDFEQRSIELLTSPAYEEWRAEADTGNILRMSDISKVVAMGEGYREAMDTQLSAAIAKDGPVRTNSLMLSAASERITALNREFLVLPAGHWDDQSLRLAGQGLLVATGQSGRADTGGFYDFEFYKDSGYFKEPGQRSAPQLMDVNDLIIDIGRALKKELEARDVSAMSRARVVTMMRLLDVYERLIDPGRKNREVEVCGKSGDGRIVYPLELERMPAAFVQPAVHDPGLPLFDYTSHGAGLRKDINYEYEAYMADQDYQRFFHNKISDEEMNEWAADPIQKSKLARMYWFNNNVQRIPGWENSPVGGLLNLRGIHVCDKSDMADLGQEQQDAFDARDTLKAARKMNIFESGTIRVKGAPTTAPR